MTFEELGVREDLLKAIQEMGYVNPMPIQEKVIPHLLNEDTDVVGLAQTGTGKTAAFGLPVLQRTDVDDSRVQALIIAPTRELCLQISGDLADYSKYIRGLKVLPVYGGSSIQSQIKALRAGVHIIVATPGRLIDLIDRKVVSLDTVGTVILDEADEMLNMGFIDDINNILTHVPEQRKMLMFSATMPPEIQKIANTFMRDPEEYVVGTRNEGAQNVRHIYYMVQARDKYLALKRIADYNPSIYGIIFCRTRRDTQEIADHLIEDGYDADALHGDLSQAQRDAVMKKFRERNLQLLVATDVAARGLDVDDLTHIINYGLPDDIDTYTHRSGRTGRAGKTGVSIAIIHSKERGKIRQIEGKIGKTFEHQEVPTPQRIIEKQLYNLADRIEKVKVDEDEMAKYLPGVYKKLEWLSEVDLIKRTLSLELNRLIEYYKDAPTLDIVTAKTEKGDAKARRGEARQAHDKDRRTGEPGYDRVYLNAGKQDGLFPGSLIDLLNKNSRGQRIDIGRIDLMAAYALFDVRKGDAHRVVSALKGVDFFGKRLYCEPADPDKDYAAQASAPAQKKRDKWGRPKPDAGDIPPKRRKTDRRDDSHGNYDKFMKKKRR